MMANPTGIVPMHPSKNIIHPTLHHYGLTTAKLEAMSQWYATVLGMSVVFETSNPLGIDAPIKVSAAWVTNDAANHRIGLIAMVQLTPDPQKSAHARLQHIAYEYASLDDLLDTYARLKEEGIVPLLTADHGPTTSMYYSDPDGNSVELLTDNFGDWEKSGHFMRTSPEFAAKPMGSYADPEELIAARTAGVAPEEIHRRAYAGEFTPTLPVDPRVLM
jgi:catechol 2,3-dioxygenase